MSRSAACARSTRSDYVARVKPLSLGQVQALPVPGKLELGGNAELELNPADGHTADGMAVWAPFAGVLVVGDYCRRSSSR